MSEDVYEDQEDDGQAPQHLLGDDHPGIEPVLASQQLSTWV